MAVCLENGAWIVEAQGFFMRHQFGLRHELMTRVNAFHLLLVTELSDGYAPPYDASKLSRKLRRDDFFTFRRFFASVTQAAAEARPNPSGGRFAIRPCPDDFACVVIYAGDGERDGDFDSGSRDGEPVRPCGEHRNPLSVVIWL